MEYRHSQTGGKEMTWLVSKLRLHYFSQLWSEHLAERDAAGAAKIELGTGSIFLPDFNRSPIRSRHQRQWKF